MTTETGTVQPILAVHGGAWDWPDDLDGPKSAGLEDALAAGFAVLTAGGSALDAVEIAVRSLEDDPVFDAGYGGYLNQDGVVQLDALIVDGDAGDFGSVAGVTNTSNPVSLARRVLEDVPECFYVGAGADQLAERFGLADVVGRSLETPAMRAYFADRRTDGPRDTVGAIAMDVAGRLASATSTSGTPTGRVGDSAIYGCWRIRTSRHRSCGHHRPRRTDLSFITREIHIGLRSARDDRSGSSPGRRRPLRTAIPSVHVRRHRDRSPRPPWCGPNRPQTRVRINQRDGKTPHSDA